MTAPKFVIAAKKRGKSTKGSLAAIRRAGNVPAVIYGLNTEPVLIELKGTDMRLPLTHRNVVFQLDVEGHTETVMFKQVERDPIRRDILHVDFLRVNDTHPVTVVIPVTTTGVPVGVKQQGGVFSVMKKNVRLRTKIAHIPEHYNIDVSEMPAGKIFYVRDLKPENGVFLTPAKTALFGVTSGRSKEDEAATPAGAPAAAAAAAKAPAAAAAKAPAKAPEKKK
jgi:large subunit ribosomal protein L25